jgi:hypothetical protein
MRYSVPDELLQRPTLQELNMTSQTNVLLRISAANTPDHTDPTNANEFYAALGMLSVSWGRLEGHATGNVLTIMTLLGVAKLPSKWSDRRDLWEKGFSSVQGLQPHKDSAVALMNAIIAAARDRNYAAHAAWGDFERGADEPTMTARALKAKKAGIIEVDDRRITLSMVKQALEECNRLNREMTHFTNLLACLAPPPASVLRM